jgi:hypothetical protein
MLIMWRGNTFFHVEGQGTRVRNPLNPLNIIFPRLSKMSSVTANTVKETLTTFDRLIRQGVEAGNIHNVMSRYSEEIVSRLPTRTI